MALTIKTNNQPRQLMSGLTLSLHVGEKKAAKIREQFDYLNNEEFENMDFVTYKGYVYGMCDFMRNNQLKDSPLSAWDGINPDSYFSGIVVRFVKDSGYNEVIMGRYFS